jgi:hypothetical protein
VIMFPRILVLLLIAVAAAGNARAEFVIARCGISDGCACSLSNLSIADFELVTGRSAPEGARDMTLVMVRGQDPYWTRADRTQINVVHGGTGQCDVQLFPPMLPVDGVWTIKAEATDLSACPLLRGKSIDTAIGGGTRSIQWQGSFHPSKLMQAGGANVRWAKMGENSWRGTLVNEQRGAASGAKVVHGFTLVSPRLIRGWSLFDFKIDVPREQASAMAAMGVPMQCRSYTPFTVHAGS